MLPEHRVRLEDEPCPVADQMLGEMYRASPHGLNELIATVSPAVRALLAVYCYRRAHLGFDRTDDRGDVRERRARLGGGQHRYRVIRAIT